MGSRKAMVVTALAGLLIPLLWIPLTVMNVGGLPKELHWLLFLSCPGWMIPWPGMPHEITSSTVWIFVGLGTVANALIYCGVVFVIGGIVSRLRTKRQPMSPTQEHNR